MVFEDVIGQASIVETLKNQISQETIAHAYLFAGIRGTGKTSTAKILSRAINCQKPDGSEPCNKCEICKGILEESIMDVVEIDAASNNSVDDVRELRENARYAPSKARNKVYIIDEVHMLSKGAFNALLKILEEPPSHTVFILATTEPEKIPETIRSRCQRFDFRRVGQDELLERLKCILADLEIDSEQEALQIIVRKADGGVRDALSILDQCLAFTQGAVTKEVVQKVLGVSADDLIFEFLDSIINGDADGAFEKLEEIFSAGKETNQFLRDLTQHMRALMISGLKESAAKILALGDQHLTRLRKQRKKAGTPFILRSLDLLSDYEYRVKYAPEPRILIEMLILRMLRPEYDNSLDSVLQRLEKAERDLAQLKESGIHNSAVEKAKYKKPSGEKPEKPKSGKTALKRDLPEKKSVKKGEEIKSEVVKSVADPNEMLSGETIYFSDLMDKWNDILLGVKEKSKLTHALLREAIPKDIVKGKLLLLFKDGYDVHMNKLNGQANKSMIESVIQEETDCCLEIDCLMQDSWGGSMPPGEEESRIKEVFKGFEGIIEIED